ncbi:MAG: prepilin-type N-terminal cleavage/methylation domain-containing protein [Pseudohongiella sp.]|nr:prepilin-type N-terminal cleavage/methylation domain-containing protein [Pseudohongiella sp.]
MTPISDSSRLTSECRRPGLVDSVDSAVAVVLKNSPQGLPNSFARALDARSSRGFTLLEILLVLTIIGMASVLLVPNLTGLESRTFSAQLRQANSLLNYARRIAVVSGQASTVSLTVGSEQSPAQESSAAQNNIVGQWNASGVEISYRDSTEREIEVEDQIEITFYPEGGSTGGTLFFTQNERQASIVINPFTGRITSANEDE